MLALRITQPLGRQHQGPIGLWQRVRAPPAAFAGIEDRLEPELAPQRARHQHGPPARRLVGLHGVAAGLRCRPHSLAVEQADQGLQVRGEEILPAEVGDDPLLRLPVFPVGLDETEVFVSKAGAAANFAGAQVHRLSRVYTGTEPTPAREYVVPTRAATFRLSLGFR